MSTSGFCVVEGVDGSGKSHLVRAVRTYLGDGGSCGRSSIGEWAALTAVLKDELAVSDGSWTRDRLAAMHALTWSYPSDEPVWTYSRRYWLHTLCAWFELVHQALVAPATAEGVVLMDGWYLKHYARFVLSGDDALIQEATAAFTALPRPDLVIVLDTSPADIRHRKADTSKPSERGAFEIKGTAGAPAHDHADSSSTREPLTRFMDYQGRTATTLEHLLTGHNIARLPGSDVQAPEVLKVIAQALGGRPEGTGGD